MKFDYCLFKSSEKYSTPEYMTFKMFGHGNCYLKKKIKTVVMTSNYVRKKSSSKTYKLTEKMTV